MKKSAGTKRAMREEKERNTDPPASKSDFYGKMRCNLVPEEARGLSQLYPIKRDLQVRPV